MLALLRAYSPCILNLHTGAFLQGYKDFSLSIQSHITLILRHFISTGISQNERLYFTMNSLI